jgi:hypothetical protein
MHWRSLGAAALFLASAPLGAQQPPPPAAASPSEERLAAAVEAVANIDEERMGNDEAYAGTIADHIMVLQTHAGLDRESRTGLQGALVHALAAAARHDAAEAAADALIALEPGSIETYAAAITAASMARRQPRLVALFDRAGRSLRDPEQRAAFFEFVTPDRVNWQLQELRRSGDAATRARLAEVLLRIGFPGAARRPAEADGLRMILAKHRLAQGDAAGAAEAAGSISGLGSVLHLVTDRRYDSVVGAADRVARVRAAIDAEDRETAARLAAAPDDTDRLVERAAFLRSIGRDGDVLTLLMPLMSDPALVVARGDKGLWLVNEATYALIATGAPDEGIELMRPLSTMNLSERPELINTSINFTSILYRSGRSEDALRETERLAAAVAESDIASDYGRMIIWSNAACAAAALGRRGVSDTWLRRMEAKAGENRGAMIEVLLCRGETEAAERALIAALEDENWRETAILWFQDWNPRPRMPVSQTEQERFLALRERPAVQAAFARVGHRLRLPMAGTVYGF